MSVAGMDTVTTRACGALWWHEKFRLGIALRAWKIVMHSPTIEGLWSLVVGSIFLTFWEEEIPAGQQEASAF